MSKPTTPLRLESMQQEAYGHLAAAEALSYEHEASQRVLALLGFELLLKLVYESKLGVQAPNTHDYPAIFDALPATLRQAILAAALRRSGPAFQADPYVALKRWGENFVSLRYPYEKYSDMSKAEFRERGEKWVREGEPLNKATFVFYPEELYAMTEALKAALDLPSTANV